MSNEPVASEWISSAQIELAQAFFALPESAGFYLAGGAALIAAGIVDRKTEDLDIFTATADIRAAVDAFAAECQRRNWRLRVDPERHFDTYTRVFVASPGISDDDAIKIEFARDAAPLNTIRTTFLGPTIDVEDSAGQKMLALFGRAAPRDFVDVFALTARFSTSQLLQFAAERDAGFDSAVFADMVAMLAHDPTLGTSLGDLTGTGNPAAPCGRNALGRHPQVGASDRRVATQVT